MEKVELLRRAGESAHTVYARVYSPMLQGKLGGHLNHNFCYGLMIPTSGADGFFQEVLRIVEHPEVDMKYSVFRPFKRAEANKATAKSRELLERMPEDRLRTVVEKADAVLQDSNLEECLARHHAILETAKPGQVLTEEQRADAVVAFKVMDYLMAYVELSEKCKVN